jgi:carboxyl-terminal processing protease
VQKGEDVTMYVTVTNVGRGRSYETQANLRNLSGDGLLLREGRFDVSNLKPGESRKVAFTFEVRDALADTEAKVELSIGDRDLRENTVEKVRIPIAPAASLAPAQGSVKGKAQGAALLESPDSGARVIGRLPVGVAAAVTAVAGEYKKVTLSEGRFAFVRASEVDSGGSPAAHVAYEEEMQRFPPAIELGDPALATRDSHFILKGSASDTVRLLDAYVVVGSRKVYYRSNRNGPDPKKMTFEADIPLRPGVNVIAVIARENPDTIGRRLFVVRRDGPNGELLATPKTDEDEAGGDD